MKWAECILEAKERKKISWGNMGRLTETSYSYWYNQIYQHRGPPTLHLARKIAEVLGMNVDHFINVVFRDRILYHLEKEGLTDNHPTKEILAFVKSLQQWAPELGQEIRYIMSTLLKRLGMDFAKDINKLEHKDPGKGSSNLTEQLRDHSFPPGAEIEQGDFSEDLEGVTG